jgi:epsilon-lactone hydrolase
MSNNNQIIEENRALYDGIGSIYPVAEGVVITEDTINNMECYWFNPENAKPNELVVYVHGGGYCVGSIRSHKAMVSHFAKGLGRTILFMEYALAPEKPYPSGLNDVVSIYEWAVQKFPNHNLYLMGDSAGGGLSIGVSYQIAEKNLKAPKAVALISPSYNLELNYPSISNRQHLDQILNKEMVVTFFSAYAGDNIASANTSKLNFKSFPPVIVGVGSHEILFDDAINFYDMVYKIQPNAQLKIYGGQGHVLTQMDIFSNASQDLISNINNFFNNN